MFKIKNNKIFLAMISIFLMVGLVGSNIAGARRAVKRVATVQKQETRDKRQEADALTVNRQTAPQPNPDAKVAIISCCYGGYELTTKPVAEQSVPCDKIFFTDNPNINNRGNWIIDTTPYHITHNKYMDTDYTNSWKNNKTNYMISKYYKAQFMDIPRLQKYDYVLVIDGNLEITNKDCIKMLIDKIRKENADEILWKCDNVRSALAGAKIWSRNNVGLRHTGGIVEDYIGQHRHYVSKGFQSNYWKNDPSSKSHGYFISNFGFYKNNENVKSMLDYWYEEILKWTTLCQTSLVYVLQMLEKENKFNFSVLPDDLITGSTWTKSTLTKRYRHGK